MSKVIKYSDKEDAIIIDCVRIWGKGLGYSRAVTEIYNKLHIERTVKGIAYRYTHGITGRLTKKKTTSQKRVAVVKQQPKKESHSVGVMDKVLALVIANLSDGQKRDIINKYL